MSMLAESLSELGHFGYLLRSWTLREIKIRYKQSLLGGLWAVLQPLSIAVIFSIVFSILVRVPTRDVPYLIFYYAALLGWTLFASAVTTGSSSLVSNLNLVTKIYFPREILPIASVLAALLDFAIATLVYGVLLLICRVSIGPSIVLLPLLIVIQVFFTSAVVLVLAALNVFYRDIRFVVPLGLQIYMYSVPLVYPVSTVPPSLMPFYMLNPMASLIHSYRAVLAYGLWPEPAYLVSALVLSIALFLASYAWFTKMARRFADVI